MFPHIYDHLLIADPLPHTASQNFDAMHPSYGRNSNDNVFKIQGLLNLDNFSQLSDGPRI